MKLTLKLTTGILAAGMMAGRVWAQDPNVIKNVQSTMNTVQQTKTNDSNAALGIKGSAPASPAAKPAAGAPAKAGAVKPAVAPAPTPAKTTPAPAVVAAKPKAAPVAKAPVAKKTTPAHPAAAAKPGVAKNAAKSAPAPAAKNLPAAKPAEAVKTAEAPKAPKPEEKKWAMSGKRDPFFSPVVQQPTGSGCSTGKKCLEIGQINLRGVVKSEAGFIAVVTNSLNKAYFLHENDPVFNGYVVRITGDTVVFQEQVLDKLGKPLTREVVKRILTPAV